MRSDDFGKLLLRLTVAGLLLFHGVAKIRAGIPHGTDWLAGVLTKNGLPDFLRWGVYIGEVIAPVLVIIGFLTRPAAIIIAINMGMAIYLVQREKLAELNQGGGWAVEVEALFLLGALAIAFLGGGRMSLRRGQAKVD